MTDTSKGVEIDPVREKLIELVDDYTEPLTVRDIHKADFSEKFADHLIANGVTIGKPLAEFLHPVDNYDGLKGKYLVFKADTGEQAANCFVLRPDKDTAAVDALRAYAKATDNETLAKDIYNWVGNGVVISNLETTTKWIPVSERLPKDTEIVLICSELCNQYVAQHYRGNFYSDGTRISTTHWMPLPPAPKGE